jgi:hypothetical protein
MPAPLIFQPPQSAQSRGGSTQPARFIVKIVPAAFVAHRMVAVTFRHPYDTRPETPAFGDAAPLGNPRGQLHSPFKSM